MTQRHHNIDAHTFYFITTNTKNRIGFLEQDDYAQLLHTHMLKAAEAENITIVTFIIMPDHLHLICLQSGDKTVSDFMRVVKSQYAYLVREKFKVNEPLWQGRFYSKELDQTSFIPTIQYIKNNPLKAGLDKKYQRNPYYYFNEDFNKFFKKH